MADHAFVQRVDGWMRLLTDFPDRHVGGEGNLAATELFAAEMADRNLIAQTATFIADAVGALHPSAGQPGV